MDNSFGFVYFSKEKKDDFIGFSFSDKYGFKSVSKKSDLDRNIMWFSNLNKSSDFYIKKNNYLTISIEEILYFLNLRSEEKIKKNIQYIYIVLKEAFLKIENNYSVCKKEEDLSIAIFKNFKTRKIKFNERLIKNFINERKDVNIVLNNFKNKQKKRIILSFIDYFNIREICKQELPLGGWKKSNIKEYNESLNKKFIFNIKIIKTKDWVSKILPINYLESAWIIDSEYKFLKEVGCKIKVLKIYSSDRTFFLKEIEPNKLFKISEEENNISNYIAAKNYLSSFKNKNSIINAWLSQYEKINSMKISFILSSMNIEVLGYGNNTIIINIGDSEKEKIINLSEKLGINYPTFILDEK